jgi:transcriptional regulator with XRE-family HTH domain
MNPRHSAPWAEALRSLMQDRGLTQVQLARIAGIDASTVSHIVHGGHCTTETLLKLSEAMQVDLADLVSPPHSRNDLTSRRDRLVAAVLRELSDDVATAVADAMHRRRRDRRVPDRTERPLPFSDGQLADPE